VRSAEIGLLFVWALTSAGMAKLMDPRGTVTAVGFVMAFLVACHESPWTPRAVVDGIVVLIANRVVLDVARGRRGFEAPPPVGPRRAV
jgi:hypothetical protein